MIQIGWWLTPFLDPGLLFLPTRPAHYLRPPGGFLPLRELTLFLHPVWISGSGNPGPPQGPKGRFTDSGNLICYPVPQLLINDWSVCLSVPWPCRHLCSRVCLSIWDFHDYQVLWCTKLWCFPYGCVIYVCIYIVLCLGLADRVCIAVCVCMSMSMCIYTR